MTIRLQAQSLLHTTARGLAPTTVCKEIEESILCRGAVAVILVVKQEHRRHSTPYSTQDSDSDHVV